MHNILLSSAMVGSSSTILNNDFIIRDNYTNTMESNTITNNTQHYSFNNYSYNITVVASLLHNNLLQLMCLLSSCSTYFLSSRNNTMTHWNDTLSMITKLNLARSNTMSEYEAHKT